MLLSDINIDCVELVFAAFDHASKALNNASTDTVVGATQASIMNDFEDIGSKAQRAPHIFRK